MPAFPSFQKTSADDPYSGSPTAMKYATGPWWNTTFEAQDKFTPSTGSGMMSWVGQNQNTPALGQNTPIPNSEVNSPPDNASAGTGNGAAFPNVPTIPSAPGVPAIGSLQFDPGSGEFYKYQESSPSWRDAYASNASGGGGSPSQSSAAVALAVQSLIGQPLDPNLLAVTGPDWRTWYKQALTPSFSATYGNDFWPNIYTRYGITQT